MLLDRQPHTARTGGSVVTGGTNQLIASDDAGGKALDRRDPA